MSAAGRLAASARRLAPLLLALGLVALAGGPGAIGPASAQARTFVSAAPDRAWESPSAVDVIAATARNPIAHAADVPYDGGEVLHWNRTHLIFWQPVGSGLTFPAGYISVIETFMARVARASHSTTNVFGLTGQYSDRGGPAAYDSSYGGAVLATDPLPTASCVEPSTAPPWPDCVDDAQLESELKHVVAARHLPSTGNDIYFLITPAGLGDCEYSGPADCALGGTATGSYCGYHSSTPTGLLYAVIPFNAIQGHCQSTNPRPNSNAADPTMSTIAHENIETITDPFGDAWVDPTGNEVADLCIASYGRVLGGAGPSAWNEVIDGGHYYLQEIWSDDSSACEPRAATDSVSFTAKATSDAAEVAFLGTGRAPGGSIVAWKWYFGDGHTGRGRRTSHVYSRPGKYRVVLRTTDSAGNWAFYAEVIRLGVAGSRSLR